MSYKLFQFPNDLLVQFVLNFGIFGQQVNSVSERGGRSVETSQQKHQRLSIKIIDVNNNNLNRKGNKLYPNIPER